MAAMPLAHVSWAIADNKDRKPCDQWVIDTFGAEPVYEMLMTPEAEKIGLDREETLMMVGDTMVIPIAPAPSGARGQFAHRRHAAAQRRGKPLAGRGAQGRRSQGDCRRVRGQGLQAALRSRYGGDLLSSSGASRRSACGWKFWRMICPTIRAWLAGWSPMRWRDDHPLGIEGLQSIGVSAPSLEVAREVFAQKLEWPEVGSRALPGEGCGVRLLRYG